MRIWNAGSLAISLLAALILPTAVQAQVTVVFGTSWDGTANSLQKIVDARYGAGAIHVTTDYIGHNAGQPDPFAWTDMRFDAMIVREVAGNANANVIGWYKEAGSIPAIDGIDDGIVFNGIDGAGATKFVSFSTPIKFGFYMNPNGPGNATNAPEPEKFYTNRKFNDLGPSGGAAIHAPFDGDVQALVFDISNVVHSPNTWLVAFEDLDSGANPGSCCTTDNDFNDLIFEVHAIGTTESRLTSLGRIKAMYRN